MYEYGLSRRLFDNGKVLSINAFYRILTIMLMATCGTIRLARAQDTPLRAGDANQDGLVIVKETVLAVEGRSEFNMEVFGTCRCEQAA